MQKNYANLLPPDFNENKASAQNSKQSDKQTSKLAGTIPSTSKTSGPTTIISSGYQKI